MLNSIGHNSLQFGTYLIDDYAKDSGPGVVWLLFSFYRDLLRSLTVKEVQQHCDLTSNWFKIEDRLSEAIWSCPVNFSFVTYQTQKLRPQGILVKTK